MDIRIVENYDEMSQKAAAIVADRVMKNKKMVLGLATGSTPEGLYALLVKMFREGRVDFSDVTCFNLDEYRNLSPEHPQSYNHYMQRHFFSQVNVKPQNINIPDCHEEEIKAACREYDQKIFQAGGIDLQLLGLGVNGHIGFNEPGSSLHVATHLVDLSEETIEANSRFFNDSGEVPRQAVTMGLGSIMQAESILLLASGKSKSEAVKAMCSGWVTTEIPASFLQLHRNAVVIIDNEAAALI